MVQIRKKVPKRSEHVRMQKGANFTIVSTMVLIGLNVKFLGNLRKATRTLIPFFLSNFLLTKSRLSLSNTKIVFADHVKL